MIKHNMKDTEIRLKCPNCGHINEPNNKSNENWIAISTFCDECGTECQWEMEYDLLKHSKHDGEKP